MGGRGENPACVLWTDSDVTKLDEFNTTMATNPRIEAFLLPLFDGVGLGRLLD